MRSDKSKTDSQPEPEPGGEAVCWLERVCDQCGALAEPPAPCWRCGAVLAAE